MYERLELLVITNGMLRAYQYKNICERKVAPPVQTNQELISYMNFHLVMYPKSDRIIKKQQSFCGQGTPLTLTQLNIFGLKTKVT